jgi:hypothetical protein
MTSGWGSTTNLVSINLWSAAPTYTNGDGGAYVPATGSAGWLATFAFPMTQFGDGAVGAGGPTNANEAAIKLVGQSIFWDLQILSTATPISGQTFTLTAELLN